jgi:hypothetical protein
VSSGPYVVLGRAADCHVVIAGPSVSSRHARLRWQQGQLFVEDLGSANGTFVDGERVQQPTLVRIGQDVRLGAEMLPWSESELRSFLRHGASDTLLSMPRFGRYRCPKCKKVGLMPLGFKQGELTCAHCQTSLWFGERPRSTLARLGSFAASFALLVAVAAAVLTFTPFGRSMLRTYAAKTSEGALGQSALAAPTLPIPEDLRLPESRTEGGPSPEESALRRSGVARRVREAMDPNDAVTRNLAVKVASKRQGTYSVEQVAAIWLHVRGAFNYVNDPRGSEYFARASETIENGFAGDCDDFAAALSAMISAIGGRTRVVMMDGVAGGHAYAEACIEEDPNATAKRLRTFVRRNWNKRLGKLPALTSVYYRADSSCAMWLNLDWNANYPGGPYVEERWAVAIESDGATETLVPQEAAPPKTKTAAR